MSEEISQDLISLQNISSTVKQNVRLYYDVYPLKIMRILDAPWEYVEQEFGKANCKKLELQGWIEKHKKFYSLTQHGIEKVEALEAIDKWIVECFTDEQRRETAEPDAEAVPLFKAPGGRIRSPQKRTQATTGRQARN
jgi:hypothetical protein